MTLSRFTDDHSIRKSFPAKCLTAEERTVSVMESTLTKIADWMTSMWLKLNSKKTEFIMFGFRQMFEHADTLHLNFGTTPIQMKQFNQIPQWSPRLLSHLQRTCKAKVQDSIAELHKDKGNRTQPHCNSQPYSSADTLHFPPGQCKCTTVWNDQEVKIKISKNSEYVCQTGSKQEKI